MPSRAQMRSAPRGSSYRWNESAGRYIAPNGRFVSNDEIRRQLDLSLRNSELRMNELASELRAGTISLEAWRAEMKIAIKDTQLYSGALARGGWAQLTQGDLSQIGKLVQTEYEYLEGFARSIADGTQTLGGSLSNRAGLYSEAGRHAYELVRTRMMREAGMTQERNVLHPADHCDECLEMTALGWVKLGTITPIGERLCGRRCRCTKAYR
jgi:hypothetical protein